MELSAIKQPN